METVPSPLKLSRATQAEILRSHQRDDEFVRHMRGKLSEILKNLKQYKSVYPYIQSDIPFRLLYFFFTSGLGNQTLGEEYTGIMQINIKAFKIPSLFMRMLGAVLECLGERILLKLLGRLQASVNDPDNKLTPIAVKSLNVFLSTLRAVIPILVLLHKGIFYIYGRYYSLGRRIAKLDYARLQQSESTIGWGLKLLGIATIIQCLLKVWQSDTMQDIAQTTNLSDENSVRHKCQLCLEESATTATLCGHLFCWNCLSNWLRKKPQCPFCREYMPPSRIVHAMNI